MALALLPICGRDGFSGEFIMLPFVVVAILDLSVGFLPLTSPLADPREPIIDCKNLLSPRLFKADVGSATDSSRSSSSMISAGLSS